MLHAATSGRRRDEHTPEVEGEPGGFAGGRACLEGSDLPAAVPGAAQHQGRSVARAGRCGARHGSAG